MISILVNKFREKINFNRRLKLYFTAVTEITPTNCNSTRICRQNLFWIETDVSIKNSWQFQIHKPSLKKLKKLTNLYNF